VFNEVVLLLRWSLYWGCTVYVCSWCSSKPWQYSECTKPQQFGQQNVYRWRN